MELSANYWSWLLYEDWPETRFRLRPITRAGHRATLATCNYQNFHGSIIMGSGALQLCRPININTAGGGSGTCGGQWRGGGERRERGLPMCSVCICALCRGHLCNLLSLMAFNVPRQAKPGQVGPPVVHWPFGRSLKLMQKLFDRFAIRRKNAKQTSGSGGQAVHQSSCQYANICIYCTCVCVCVWPVQGVCIIAVPKLEIYYNFHTSVTRCRRHIRYI